jgi:hypothetical protein
MRALGFAVLVTMSLLMASQAGCEEKRDMTEETILSKLTVGMQQGEVEAFFADHGIEYSLIPPEELEGEQDLSRDPSKLGGRYVAIIRNVAHTDLAFESITISVEIDHDGRVVHVDVGRVTTGI